MAKLAGRQYGYVTRVQLLALGLDSNTITRWIEFGRLIPVHHGVYAVGHVPAHPAARAAAAVLACGPGAVLSHESAAALWGVRKRWPERPDVTVPGDRRRPGILVHRSTALTRHDVRCHLGIRVASPARTVLDIAPGLTEPALARAVNDARIGRLLRPSDLAELIGRQPRHPGARRLRRFIEAPTGPTRSQFEDAFVVFARRSGLPAPEINTHVAGWEVDALFAAERLIVELDGYEYHGDRRSFERDRERDAATLAAGHATVRVTWSRLSHGADREAARLHAILSARRDNQPPTPR